LIIIVLGAILGLILYWIGARDERKGRRTRYKREDVDDLDDWDQQDQLEGDEV